jgi:hypothetical protein
MTYIPSRERTFPFRLDILACHRAYIRWLRHLGERLGYENTLSVWQKAFGDYQDRFLMEILSGEWQKVDSDDADKLEDKLDRLFAEFFPITYSVFSSVAARKIIENTPPIPHIRKRFSLDPMGKQISAFEALHLRFDGLACLAETLIEMYAKQGELIVYDLILESRLEVGKDKRGSVEEFIEDFTAKPATPDLFTAGLEIEIVSKTNREAVANVRECEWARYYREWHPRVGYLMACSTDEAAYKAFNPSLRLRRTGTLMEGSDVCDFQIFAID